MSNADIFGISLFITIVTPAMGLVSIMVGEMTIDEHDNIGCFDLSRILFDRLGLNKVKVNVFKLLYGWLILSLSNLFLVLMPLWIVDLLLWILQIKYSTTKAVGKFLYHKLKLNEHN